MLTYVKKPDPTKDLTLLANVFCLDGLDLFNNTEIDSIILDIVEETKDLQSITSIAIENYGFALVLARAGGNDNTSKETIAAFSYLYWTTGIFNVDLINAEILKIILLGRIFRAYKEENLAIGLNTTQLLENLGYDPLIIELFHDHFDIDTEELNFLSVEDTLNTMRRQTAINLKVVSITETKNDHSKLTDILNDLNINMN